MGFDSIWHWLILLVIVLAIFGTKKLTNFGPDLGNAMREFKKALRKDDDDEDDAAKQTQQNKESLKADEPEAAPTTAKAKRKRAEHEAKS